MPEGPEIWRAADRISDALSGQTITGIYFEPERLKKFEPRLKGKSITAVEPRGKAILTFFDNDLAMYSHNQLYGKWLIEEAGVYPDTNRTLRVAIHNSHYSAYLYSATEIEILPAREAEDHPYIKKLGPDVVHPSTTFETIADRFMDARFQNRQLAGLLLDPAFLSGVGNYLRSEIMFYAKVWPFMKLKEYTDEQKQALAHAIQLLSKRSYKTKGIITDPDIAEALKREGAGRAEYRFFVYKRTGQRCRKCGSLVMKEETGGRKIYFCSSCQAPPN